ncbi:MAG: putative ABC transporter ATP-binding protein [Firmicutes bacterium ADurb.Bin182]|nr:MAG: putative ABC transporter ATP-binding protein [Firmicutes bacterium ADurb.Bin182]
MENRQREAGPRLHGPMRHITAAKAKDAKGTLKRLSRYLAKYKRSLALLVVLVVIGTACSLAASYLLRPAINNVAQSGDIGQLAATLLIMLLLHLTASFITYIQGRTMVTVSQHTVADLRRDLFSRLQDLSLRFFDSNPHGDIMSRFTNDLDHVSEALNMSATQVISTSIMLAGSFVIMLVTSPLLTLIILIVIPLMLFAARKIMKQSRKYFSEQQAALGSVNGYIEENAEGQRVVKVFNRQKKSVEEFENLNERLRQKSVKAQFFSGIMMPLAQSVNTVNYALTAMAGGLLAASGFLDLGGLALFLTLSTQFTRPLNEMMNQFNVIQAAIAGAERVFAVMDEKSEADEGNKTFKIKGDVRFVDVGFSYEPGKPVLKRVSFYAKPGQKIALVGSTGAGKTTIINLLARFYDVSSGSITVDGTDIRDIPLYALRGAMALVLQDTHLFTGTVLDNIRYGRLDASDDEVIEAAKLSNAHSFIKRLPNGYDTIITADGASLSQGQRQLLSIARAAVADPPILILDEATSSVDTRTEKLIEKGMDKLMEGRTTFVIAHRLSTVRNANAIMVIENGEIIERGDHSDLLKQKGRYFELYTGKTELT